jgi:proteasome activator subunit 4
MCLSGDKPEERLFLQDPVDTTTTEIELKDTSAEFTESYLRSFREPLLQDGSEPMMQDLSETGWLVWGKTMEVSRVMGPDEDEDLSDPESNEGIQILKDVMTAPEFWQTVSPIVLHC